ncbi:MAG: ferrous iron transport protein A [Chlorobiales bacterium]|nr:ferrous iron transport protein A [Chlorobiales bacterium]
MLPLGHLQEGESAEVVGFRKEKKHAGNGWRHAWGFKGRHDSGRHWNGWEKRLAELGFNRGQIVEMLKNHSGLPLLVRIGDGKMALDKQSAMEIIVRRISS